MLGIFRIWYTSKGYVRNTEDMQFSWPICLLDPRNITRIYIRCIPGIYIWIHSYFRRIFLVHSGICHIYSHIPEEYPWNILRISFGCVGWPSTSLTREGGLRPRSSLLVNNCLCRRSLSPREQIVPLSHSPSPVINPLTVKMVLDAAHPHPRQQRWPRPHLPLPSRRKMSLAITLPRLREKTWPSFSLILAFASPG